MGEPQLSIIIPTKNGASDVEKCLDGVFAQHIDIPYEVIVIDSGSTDSTLQIVRKFLVKLVEIEPRDFGHGKTRNLGAALAKGKYLVYLVQDAYPANEHWLGQLVQNLEQDDRVAGAYSRWLPKPDCNPVHARWIREHFSPVKEIRSLDGLDENDYLSNIRKLIVFSNVSSCIRKAVWEGIPFDETLTFGEDQQWSKKVLQAGHAIIYEPESIVYHSHNESFKQRFKTSFDAALSFKKIAGVDAGLLSIVPSVLAGTARDWKFMGRSSFRRNASWLIYSVIAHATVGLGWWLGTHHKYIPDGLKRRISMVPHMFE